MRNKIIICLFLPLLIVSCTTKNEPLVITKTEYQEVVKPVKCVANLPSKPKFDKNDLNSVKDITQYYLTIEDTLKRCVSDE